MKKIFLILVIIIFIGIGIFYSYKTFNSPVKITEIKDSPFSVLLENQKEIFSENTDWYEVKIEYPKHNTEIRDQLIGMWNNFAKENELKNIKTRKEAEEKLGLGEMLDQKYTFFAEYKLATSTNSFGETFSYVYQIYTYTGGAHGGTDIHPITIDKNLKEIPIESILPKNILGKVSEISLSELIKQRKERMKSFDMTEKEISENLKDDTWMKEGSAPTRENYNRAWFDQNNLIIAFGQYQVASYAEGIFEIKIPLAEIFTEL